jgi:hypothetical protein
MRFSKSFRRFETRLGAGGGHKPAQTKEAKMSIKTIPQTLPGLIQITPEPDDRWTSCEAATAGDWRAAKRLEIEAAGRYLRTHGWRKRAIGRMVALADALGVPDDAVLMHRLRTFPDEARATTPAPNRTTPNGTEAVTALANATLDCLPVLKKLRKKNEK